MSETTLKGLIIGPSGHGKSWVLSTLPRPRLILDMEGRTKWTPNGRQATFWDGVSDPMKLTPSPTGTYIVRTNSIETIEVMRQWIRSGKHPFISFGFDSIMEYQIRDMQRIRPGKMQFRPQDWGDVLRSMEVVIREIGDYVDEPTTKLKMVCFVAGATTPVEGAYVKPLLQGGITTRIPYWMDLVGFLEAVADEKGVTTRNLWIAQRPNNDLQVRDGTDILIQKFGSKIENPDLTEIYNILCEAEKKEEANGINAVA